MPRRERDDKIAMAAGGWIRQHHKAAVRRSREGGDRALDVGGGVCNGSRYDLDRERGRRGLCRAPEVIKGSCLRVAEDSNAREARRDLLEHRQPLSDDARLVEQQAGQIAARPREICNKARADRVGDFGKHDRNCIRFPLHRGGDWGRMG